MSGLTDASSVLEDRPVNRWCGSGCRWLMSTWSYSGAGVGSTRCWLPPTT
jgi:hypothetical protein